MRQPGDRLLDPSCGEGAFLRRAARHQRWLAISGAVDHPAALWGVEIDPAAAASARASLQEAQVKPRILVEDFFALQPGEILPDSFDCIVGNPPYTRSEWLGGRPDQTNSKDRLAQSAAPLARLGRRSGLHAYFFVHGYRFLRPRGRFGFVVSNSWLDVDYGTQLKRFLLEHFKIIAVVESAVERWFSQAEINTCLVVLEKCDDPAERSHNQVRFARLMRPLHDYFASGQPVEVENFIMRLLPGRSRLSGDVRVRVLPQADIAPERKWGPYLRAPQLFFHAQQGSKLVPLGELVEISRGQTTGANHFFYLSPEQMQRWEIEERFTRPLLKSPKELEIRQVGPEGLKQRLLAVAQETEELAGSQVLRYLQWGESKKIHQRSTCARRSRWYSLSVPPEREARVVWVKGIWNRHFAALLDGRVVADQQFYDLRIGETLTQVLAALLNSSWAALQAELLGRSNFGEGVLWLAGYEVARIRLPDPRTLAPAERSALEESWREIATAPILPVAEQVAQASQQKLDQVVFDLLQIGPRERAEVLEALCDLTHLRISRAQAGRG